MTSAGRGEIAPPILEEKYSLLDAIVVGGLGITLLNNADVLEIACLAQLINVIAPITTMKNGGIFKQAIYHPFHMLSTYGRGTAMKASTEAPKYHCDFGDLSVVESAVVYNKEKDEVRIFVLNCDQEEEVEFEIELQGYGNKQVKKHLVLRGDDDQARNTFENPANVVMKELPIEASKNLTVLLPKMSWNVIILGQ
ncbi:hypothetical protein CG709_05720 [Lachnotalea glycerini]|nr:hypothetical protein CG709_05720 [Lachnotalea glycerini]